MSLVLKDERGTLTRVAEFLERTPAEPALKDKLRGRAWSVRINGHSIGFNMAEAGNLWECGAVACIGGFAWLWERPDDFEGARAFVNYPPSEALNELFYPSSFQTDEEGDRRSVDYRSVTPKQAAAAIRNYLASGEADWDSILEESNLE